MNKWIVLAFTTLFFGCNGNNKDFDAQGTFEATETMVSSEVNGRIIEFSIHEGDVVSAMAVVGKIDDANLSLQKQQIQASIEALSQKTTDAAPQVKLLNEQLNVQKLQQQNLQKELLRMEKLFKSDAATEKQVDDLQFQLEALQKQMLVTQQQIAVQQANNQSHNRTILSEKKPLEKRAEQIDDLLRRSSVFNPVTGTVISTYAEVGEMAVAGKPLYKIANLDEMNLRAYVTGDQLSSIKLNQLVKVFVDKGADDYTEYKGMITWISPKAEFTPKTIQTKSERANLVYAIKIAVKNDGFIKIGMYGEIKL